MQQLTHACKHAFLKGEVGTTTITYYHAVSSACCGSCCC